MIKKINLILPLFMALITFVSLASAHVGEDEGIHHEGCGMMGSISGSGLGMFFGWVFMILVFIALVLLIVWLIKQVQKK